MEGPVLEGLPIATPLDAHQPPEPRRWKVARRHDRVLCLYTVEEPPPDLSRQSLVHLEEKTPVDLGNLARMTGYVAHN